MIVRIKPGYNLIYKLYNKNLIDISRSTVNISFLNDIECHCRNSYNINKWKATK